MTFAASHMQADYSAHAGKATPGCGIAEGGIAKIRHLRLSIDPQRKLSLVPGQLQIDLSIQTVRRQDFG
jgi:hypothetical protein